jgi:hypothetical protein
MSEEKNLSALTNLPKVPKTFSATLFTGIDVQAKSVQPRALPGSPAGTHLRGSGSGGCRLGRVSTLPARVPAAGHPDERYKPSRLPRPS